MDKIIKLDCGAEAILEQGYSYRCMECFAVWGSMGCACSRELLETLQIKKKQSSEKSENRRY